MTINVHARTMPDKVALRLAENDATMTFAELDDSSARFASVLRGAGIAHGERIAILLENCFEYYVTTWACRRAGIRSVPINWHLTPDEAGYVVEDSDSVALITSPGLLELAHAVKKRCPALRLIISTGPAQNDVLSFHDAISAAEPWPITDEPQGNAMPYSSGTSGRPKGILRPMAPVPFGQPTAFDHMVAADYGIGPDAVYLSPAPLYHAAPLGWSMTVQALGGSVSLMSSFDAERVLQVIERDRVTHAQFVPTHFIRMLKLPEDVRQRYDVSSLKYAIHAAAPCPADVKRAMIDWWGPVIHEYYSGSEGGGFVSIDSADWLAHPGSVGRLPELAASAYSTPGSESGIRIVDIETGKELPAGEVGLIYFAGAARFEYHKDPGKTAEFFNDRGWGTLGDMGWVDDEGYLYLSDRKSHMIISGGVNIYPQEAESVLALHPAVGDVAVIGVPHPEFGEEVKAVVEPAGPVHEGLAEELIAYCRERLAHFKCPRSVDFIEKLPRLPNGKLLKRDLRKTYWPEGRAQI